MKTSHVKLVASFAMTLFAAGVSAQSNQYDQRVAANIADGSASKEEQFRYINACVNEPSCSAALTQIWQANGKDVAMERYLPPEDKVPALLRGTEMGRKMRDLGAINRCAPDDRCRAFLVEATSTIRALPADALRQAHAGSEASGRQTQAAQVQQMQANLAQAMARAGGMPQERVSAAALQDNEPAGVLDFARDPFSGVTMQLVKRADGNREIQRRSADGVKRLAMVMGREGKWLIQLNDGTDIEAADIQLTSRGFLAGAQGQPVSYTEAGGIQKLSWPQNFHPAAIQRGNVARTGYLLLERNQAPNGSVDKLLTSFKGLGASLGAGRNEDYVLMDLHSGRTFPINSNASGKEVMRMSNCQRRNAITNVCRDATSSEQLYNSMGKNMGHYAWTIHWFRAPTGTFLVALEDGVRTLSVTHLESGEKRIAFSRTLGIADFNAEQADNGKLKLSAKMAFDVKTIDDLEAGFPGLPLAPPVAGAARR